MRSILKMPKVGDAANEVVIMELLVKVGDTVAAGQNLFTVETDKATLEVPAPFGGTVSEILVKVGE
jgi:pyruvate dehydrogenase E2 component (dihydrolipoamide acetyltransferase)